MDLWGAAVAQSMPNPPTAVRVLNGCVHGNEEPVNWFWVFRRQLFRLIKSRQDITDKNVVSSKGTREMFV